MKRLDVAQRLREEIKEEDRLAALHVMIEGQINALERLMETNATHVKDPGAWNILAGYIDQLRFWAPRVFYTSEVNADFAEKQEGVPAHPMFGKFYD